MRESHEEITWRKKLPRVGQTIRNKQDGTLWRVIEKREVWQNIEDDPKTGEPRMVPAIYLAFWRIEERVMPGVGTMVGHLYTLYDDTFKDHWEILK